ncbi:MAG: hypothetical protein AB2813_07765 [Candidatus Sedimenticola endophacoides]
MPNSVGHARGEKQVLIIGRLQLERYGLEPFGVGAQAPERPPE